MADEVHRFPVRVYFEDTDAGGIVYYANYLRFAERARTEMLREMGRSHAAMIGDSGRVFAVRRCTADFLRPAVLDDMLEVRTRLTAVGGASVEMEQHIAREGEDLVVVQVRLACIDENGKPARIPADVKEILETHYGRFRRS